MSINSLFSNNDYHLECDTLTCNNLVPGSIVNTNAIYRLNVDPTSNPDPFTGGLIVTAASTSAFNFILPLTSNQIGLGLANTVAYDPHNHLSFNGTNITCNKTGNYNISLQLDVLSNLATPNNICIAQITYPAENIFAGPPGVSAASNFISISTTPISAIYNIASLTSGSAVIHLNQGDQFDLKFYLAYDTCTIALTSNISIIEL